MAIRYEYGPPPSALGALAYQSGVQQAQDRRRKELEALQVQAAQMRQQRQQAGLNRQFDAWRTQYGHHSAMARAQDEHQWRDQAQQKEFVQQTKVNEFQEEARKRAARQANILSLAKQKRQYELADDNAAAGHARTQMSHWFDEQMDYLTPDGQTEAQKIYRKHQKRRNEGTLSPDDVWKDELQMYQEIDDLYDDPGLRSRKGKPGWSEIKVNNDGIYTENYTMPDGTTGTRYAPHPQGGIHRTANDLAEFHDRNDRKRTYTLDGGTPNEREMYSKATVHVKGSKDGSNYIEVTFEPTELKSDRKKSLERQTEFDKQLNTTAPAVEENNPKYDAEQAQNNPQYAVKPTLKVRRVRGKNRRQMLLDKYGPMRDYDTTLKPGEAGFDPGNVHPRITPQNYTQPDSFGNRVHDPAAMKIAHENELLRRNRLEINEAVGRDQVGGDVVDEVDQVDVADEAADVQDPAQVPGAPPAHLEPDEEPAPVAGAAAAPAKAVDLAGAPVFTAEEEKRTLELTNRPLRVMDPGGNFIKNPPLTDEERQELGQLKKKAYNDLIANTQRLANNEDRAWIMELAQDPAGWQKKYPLVDAAGRPTVHGQRKDKIMGQLTRIQEERRQQAAEEQRVDKAELGRFHGWVDETMNNLKAHGKLTPERAKLLEEAKNIQGKSPEELKQLRQELEAELNVANLLGQSAQVFRKIFA